MSINSIHTFWQDEAAAITVDWVVLTAAITGLGIATTATVGSGVSNASSDTSDVMSDFEIPTSFGTGYIVGEWDQHNPGIVASYQDWISGFEDQQLLADMANMEQIKDMPANSGHP